MLSASIVVFSIVHKEVVMEKKRKTLLFKGLTIIAILILGILVLSSCEQPGSVEDSSSQNKTSPPSSVIDFNVQFEEVNYQAPEETELDSDTQSEEENDQQSEETALAEVGSDDSTEASVQVNDSDGTSALVNVDDNIVSVIVSVTPRIQGIELSAPSNSVEYDGSLDIKANLTPENAGPERLKWNLKYDNGSEVGENDGIRLIDNGDGTYTPKTVYMDANTYYQSYYQNAWENFVYKASYLKMRELSVRYNVPTAWLAKHNWGVKAASLSFVASNPWLIYSAVPNLDPSEIGGVTYGYMEGGQAPSTKSFGFTVNLTF